MKTRLFVLLSALVLTIPGLAHAQSAYGQLGDAYQDGQDAISAPTDDEARYYFGRTFDGYGTTPVDTTSPSEGDSGLSNAPTYDEDSGSGLSNAPTYGD